MIFGEFIIKTLVEKGALVKGESIWYNSKAESLGNPSANNVEAWRSLVARLLWELARNR